MQTLLSGAAFVLFVTAQILAVIAVHAARGEDPSAQSSSAPDHHRTRFLWWSPS